YGQRRLWALDRLGGPSATYNMPLALRLAGPLQVNALRQTIAAIVSRHEALRTVIVEGEDGTPEGRLLAVPDPATLLTVTDLCAQDEAEREAIIRGLIAAEAATPFHLDRDLS